MKFKTLLTLGFVSFLWPAQSSLANSASAITDSYTVYLVRHAEKQQDSKNPALTECGQLRAQQLATMLEQAKIEAIYSTKYRRTEQTAAPIAKQLSLPVQPYSPRDLTAFAKTIRAEKKNVLIVGHSNTTPQLTSFIAQSPVEPITEKEYQMLYQVSITNNQASLTRLKQPLQCDK